MARNRSKAAKKRHELAQSQGWQCCYCENRFTKKGTPGGATLEHLTPKALGGTNERSNLAAACWRCNQKYGRDTNAALQQR